MTALDPALLALRTPQQIQEGRLANDKLDPRGYTVTCPRFANGTGGCGGQGQWWGTPDNLPITHAECRRQDCPCRKRVGI